VGTQKWVTTVIIKLELKKEINGRQHSKININCMND
jgi:hypothetical protein